MSHKQRLLIIKDKNDSRCNSITTKPEMLTMCINKHVGSHDTDTLYVAKTTVEAILKESNGKTVVLNFASGKRAGGGYRNGKMAQEESLCYSSNLYYILRNEKHFYDLNSKVTSNGFYQTYTDNALYAENVEFFRDQILNFTTPVYVDVISVPAINYYKQHSKYDGIVADLMKDRIDKILSTMASKGAETIILGAYGCGVFGNDTKTIAGIFNDLIYDKYDGVFKKVVFAIPDYETLKIFSPEF